MASIADIQFQLWILGLVRATEAVAWSSIFPYAYYMVQSFEVPEHDIAFYSGALVAVFTLGEFLTGLAWAHASDRIGRKPTLMIGTIAGLVSALALGLSRSVAVAIASRAFGGLFNPNVGLVQTCVGELATKEQQAQAFSLVSFIRSLGNLVGPVLGGLLANPVALYPSIFAPNSIWHTYPYLLPNFVIGLLQILTLLSTFFFLRETHPHLAERWDLGHSVARLVTDYFKRDSLRRVAYAPLPVGPASAEAPPSTAELHQPDELEDQGQPIEAVPTRAFTLQVVLEILAISLLAFHKVSSDAATGTFLSLAPPSSQDNNARSAVRSLSFPQSNGGFSLDTRAIGIIFLTEAIFRVVIQPTFIPWFIAKLGALAAFRCVLGLYPAMYLATPFLPNLPTSLGLGVLLLDLWMKVALSSVGYICSAVLITNASPSRVALARINGAAAMFGCLARSLGPLLTGKLFALGLKVGYLQIPFWTLGAVALLGALESLCLSDGGS